MIYKRGETWWMDAVIDGHRYRESLRTKDKREAKDLEKTRVAEIKGKAPRMTRSRKEFGNLVISEAIEIYARNRAAQVAPKTLAYWCNQAKPMIKSKALGRVTLKNITSANISCYQNERVAQGRAPKTINGEVSVLRLLLEEAGIWYRVGEDYKQVKNTRPPVGRALTSEQVARLVEVASSREDWRYAHAAIVLGFYCGMRACEILGLKWKDIHFDDSIIDIKRSKTEAGHRSPSMNATCARVLKNLHANASLLDAGDPEHYVFPWHGREQKINPSQPMTTWKTAFNSITRLAGIKARFHDGRHTVITTLAEKGVSDWIIQAQVGHVDARMMKTYSHIRRKALDEAAAALEPSNTAMDSEMPEERLVG